MQQTHFHSQQQATQYQCTLRVQQTHYQRVWQVRAWLQSLHQGATLHQTHHHSHQQVLQYQCTVMFQPTHHKRVWQARSRYRLHVPIQLQLIMLWHSPRTTQRPSAQNYVRSWQHRRTLHQLCTSFFTIWGSLTLKRYHTSRSTSFRRFFRRANSHGSNLLQHCRQDPRLELRQPSPCD